MTQSVDTALTKAFELIEANQIDEARDILEPLLDEHPDNADVWWVYAHSVDNPNEARQALERVKEIDPDYPEVDALLAKTESEQPEPQKIRRIKPLPKPAPFDIEDDFDDEEFDTEIEEDSSRSNVLPIIVAIIFGAVIVIAVIFFALNQSGQPPETPIAVDSTQSVSMSQIDELGVPPTITEEIEPTVVTTVEAQAATIEVESPVTEEVTDIPIDPSTEILTPTEVILETEDSAIAAVTEETAEFELETEEVVMLETEDSALLAVTEEAAEIELETEEATEEPTPTATGEPPTEIPTETPTNTPDPISNVASAFGNFDLYEDEPVVSVTTPEGETFLVQVCVDPADNRFEILSDAVDVLVNSPELVDTSADFAGISLFDCDSGNLQRSVAFPVDALSAFIAENIDEREFQLTWRGVG